LVLDGLEPLQNPPGPHIVRWAGKRQKSEGTNRWEPRVPH
jgi:hypothetical protein